MEALARLSASVAESHAEEQSELERAALENIHAKRLANKEAVLVKVRIHVLRSCWLGKHFCNSTSKLLSKRS